MIARRYETIVGIFVVASMAALLIMVLIMAQQEGLFQEYVKYRTIFKNVSGLKSGSEVHLAGVTVGNVLTITINPEGNIVVTFQVLKKNSDRIREDSRSTIGFMGLLGDKSLDLTSGSLSKPAIPPEGLVTSVEPLDITQLLARAAPAWRICRKSSVTWWPSPIPWRNREVIPKRSSPKSGTSSPRSTPAKGAWESW